MTGVAILAAVVIAVAAIIYVWRHLAGGSTRIGDGTPGTVLDAADSVRRIDLGGHAFVAQQAHAELEAAGLKVRVVSHDRIAFGIGAGEHYFLVYQADDEAMVRTVVDELLADLDPD